MIFINTVNEQNYLIFGESYEERTTTSGNLTPVYLGQSNKLREPLVVSLWFKYSKKPRSQDIK